MSSDAIVIHTPTTAPTGLLLMAHGVGASADDLVPLGRFVAQALPNWQVVSLNAPDASDFGQGRQWFSVMGVTEANRAARVDQALPAFAALVAQQQAEAGVGADRTVLLGFSQGSIMSLASTQAPTALAQRVIAIAGRFAQPPHQAPLNGGAVHLLHGDQDTVIPAQCSRDAAAQLQALSAPATLDLFPGLGHGVDARVAHRVVALLQAEG
ncbi:MAG: hypothetical protein RJA98_3135 [Pseudomonadota bacterium]|jgi:phospholipase/carboxylesterase